MQAANFSLWKHKYSVTNQAPEIPLWSASVNHTSNTIGQDKNLLTKAARFPLEFGVLIVGVE